MFVKSKVPVTYNDGIKSQAEAIIEGHIVSSSWTKPDYSEIGFNYAYSLEPNDEGQRTIINQGGFTLKGEQIEAVYQMVKDQVPTDLDYANTQLYTHYLGFILEMAQTFEIDPSDIEIVQ